jgi:hypothetical protein
MYISNLTNLSSKEFNLLSGEIKSLLNSIIRENDNYDKTEYFIEKNKVFIEFLKINTNEKYDYFKSHIFKFEIIFVQSGNLSIQAAFKGDSIISKLNFEDSNYDYYYQDNYYEINNIKKGSIIVIENPDIYKLHSKDIFSKIILFKIL